MAARVRILRGLERAEAVEAGRGAARIEQGFLAFEEAGGEQGIDGGGDFGGRQGLGASLEIGLCHAFVPDQKDGSQDLRLSFSFLPSGPTSHTNEGSRNTNVCSYVRVGI